ncbi:MAG: hypothetical protein WA728_31465 [Xanthobacteraceae bacterium]
MKKFWDPRMRARPSSTMWRPAAKDCSRSC